MKAKHIILALVCSASVAMAASFSTSSFSSAKSQFLGAFASGSVVSGSSGAGNVERWFLFNEGHIGYSYSTLGELNLHSADIGYSIYITSIQSLGGLRPYFGIEATAPIYLKSVGSSNAFSTGVDTGLPNGAKVMQDVGFNGFGLQVPIVLGIQANTFYIQGMLGYAYHKITDNFFVSDVQNDTSLSQVYQGLTYGVGVGIRFKNVFSFGARYVMGELTSSNREAGANINMDAIRAKDFKDKYQRFSLIFGIMF